LGAVRLRTRPLGVGPCRAAPRIRISSWGKGQVPLHLTQRRQRIARPEKDKGRNGKRRCSVSTRSSPGPFTVIIITTFASAPNSLLHPHLHTLSILLRLGRLIYDLRLSIFIFRPKRDDSSHYRCVYHQEKPSSSYLYRLYNYTPLQHISLPLYHCSQLLVISLC
jgi:hypothetical protein